MFTLNHFSQLTCPRKLGHKELDVAETLSSCSHCWHSLRAGKYACLYISDYIIYLTIFFFGLVDANSAH